MDVEWFEIMECLYDLLSESKIATFWGQSEQISHFWRFDWLSVATVATDVFDHISTNIPTVLANFLGIHNSILSKNIGHDRGNTRLAGPNKFEFFCSLMVHLNKIWLFQCMPAPI